MEEIREVLNHDVTITSRKKIQMTGISDVLSFDDGQIMAQNSDSDVSIEGEGLKIEKFDSSSGMLTVNGKINGLYYYGSVPQKKKKSITGLFK
ncbi:MAG: hypothetical protein IJW19_06075 [Clostridia bacterium]|nr:hypothetical protein [Clostridia bacterium]